MNQSDEDVGKDDAVLLNPPLGRCRQGLGLANTMSLCCPKGCPIAEGPCPAVVTYIEPSIPFLGD